MRRSGDPAYKDFSLDATTLVSPDGALIAGRKGGGCNVLVVARPDGSGERVMDHTCNYWAAGWPPDSRRLLVMDDTDGIRFTMLAVSVETAKAVPLVVGVEVNHRRHMYVGRGRDTAMSPGSRAGVRRPDRRRNLVTPAACSSRSSILSFAATPSQGLQRFQPVAETVMSRQHFLLGHLACQPEMEARTSAKCLSLGGPSSHTARASASRRGGRAVSMPLAALPLTDLDDGAIEDDVGIALGQPSCFLDLIDLGVASDEHGLGAGLPRQDRLGPQR